MNDLNFILSNNYKMKKVYFEISRVAKTNSNVLIIGETGVGKELIARLIHKESIRSENKFIALNCTAIPENLIESELFGHVKGSFTGAYKDKIGKFEAAEKGTLFLDEISEIPINLQTKLLRILQEREIEKIGSNKSIKVNIRLITATNEDLKTRIKDKKFRKDFYYRISSFPIFIPPLRERKEDILLLSKFFIGKYNKVLNKNVIEIDEKTQDALFNYDWPGNVRELENVIERSMILEDGINLCFANLPSDIIESYSSNSKKKVFINSLKNERKNMIENFEKDYFENLNSIYSGNIKKIAVHANISLRSAQIFIKKYIKSKIK
jgi:transcriptional regulator with PAS, ATPase and Fis domain